MKVTIWLKRGGRIRVHRMPADSVMGLLDEWRFGKARVLTVSLDGESTSDIARREISHIDTDPEETP